MKDTDFFGGIVFFLEIQNKIQEQAAVLSTGKRDVNIIKFFKNKLQAFLKCIIYILLGILSFHAYTSKIDKIFHLLKNLAQTGQKFK